MSLGVQYGAMLDRIEADLRESAVPSIVPLPFAPEPETARASLFPEADCVRHLLPPDVIAAAEQRAAEAGVGVDRVLICAGVLNEETYLRELAGSLGISFENFRDVRREHCPLNDERLIESAAAGILPLTREGELLLVTAPRDVRQLLGVIALKPELARRFCLTSNRHIQRFVFQHGGNTLGRNATEALGSKWPMLSAAPPRLRTSLAPALTIGLLIVAGLVVAPAQAMLAFEVMLTTVFLAWMALRLAGIFIERPGMQPPQRLRDDELPVYTIIAALYREAASVEQLVDALARIDYPLEKLDIKLVIEADDHETRAAIARLKRGPSLEVIIAPAFGPRTKPKALNVALPFARGTFTAVYDAEDCPEPDQLRQALDTFLAGGDDLACVQACLTIDNTADSWLAGLYTAEYAGQFDVFLPGLAALRMPLPLGGTSNHFRTAILRETGAWDAYNVTEDADLGMRLARFGYRSSVIESTTYEEAPARFVPWLRQRTRWFKGWMQTWLVHMRQPVKLLRDLGLPALLTFQLMVGGNVLAALVHPLFVAGFIYTLATGGPMWGGDGASIAMTAGLYGVSIALGYVASAFLGGVGLLRRGLLSTGWVLLFTPIHWLLLSLAAWRALYQLVRAPYRWDKTDHGFARSSRMAEATLNARMPAPLRLFPQTIPAGAGDQK
jgi:cellulose synthase/poly-beta-1,6-N-acetylglucosamine synthase-like glycosyltransferase